MLTMSGLPLRKPLIRSDDLSVTRFTYYIETWARLVSPDLYWDNHYLKPSNLLKIDYLSCVLIS